MIGNARGAAPFAKIVTIVELENSAVRARLSEVEVA